VSKYVKLENILLSHDSAHTHTHTKGKNDPKKKDESYATFCPTQYLFFCKNSEETCQAMQLNHIWFK
jgi:hypothetical protein